MPRDDNSVNVEIELLRISNNPFEGAPAVLDGRGVQRNGRPPVLHVDDIPASLKIGKQLREGTRAVSENPTATVNVDQGRDRLFSRLVTPQVKFQRIIVLHSVANIGVPC